MRTDRVPNSDAFCTGVHVGVRVYTRSCAVHVWRCTLHAPCTRVALYTSCTVYSHMKKCAAGPTLICLRIIPAPKPKLASELVCQ